jgi:hypothetical protein
MAAEAASGLDGAAHARLHSSKLQRFVGILPQAVV